MSKTQLVDYWSQEWYLEADLHQFMVVSRDLARIGELWLDCPMSTASPSTFRLLHVVRWDSFGANGLN